MKRKITFFVSEDVSFKEVKGKHNYQGVEESSRKRKEYEKNFSKFCLQIL